MTRRVGLVHQRLRGEGAREEFDLVQSDPPVIPEPSTHRSIRTRLEVVGSKGREQRQGRDHRGALVGDESRKFVQVPDVAGAPRALRMQREDRRLDRIRSPIAREAVRCAAQRTHEQRRPDDASSHDDAELVITHAHGRQGQTPGPRLLGRRLEHREFLGAHVPGVLTAELELDAALEPTELARHAQRHHGADPLVDDVDRLEDALDSALVVLTQRAARATGGDERGHVVQGIEHRHQHLGRRRAVVTAAVDVLGLDAACVRQVEQRK